jgi:hypothetical protein
LRRLGHGADHHDETFKPMAVHLSAHQGYTLGAAHAPAGHNLGNFSMTRSISAHQFVLKCGTVVRYARIINIDGSIVSATSLPIYRLGQSDKERLTFTLGNMALPINSRTDA